MRMNEQRQEGIMKRKRRGGWMGGCIWMDVFGWMYLGGWIWLDGWILMDGFGGMDMDGWMDVPRSCSNISLWHER